MFYLAEIGNLGILVALIWWIASSLLNSKKKRNNNVITDDISDKKSPVEKTEIFDWKTQLEGLFQEFIPKESISQEFENSDEIEDEDQIIIEPINKTIQDDSEKEHQRLLHREPVVKNNKSTILHEKLKDSKEIQQAIILNEILGKPVSLKKFFNR